MPNDSVYITILRNPVSQFESVYEYDEFRLRYHVNMTTFFRNVSRYFPNEPLKPRIAGRNSMMFDLGLDARHLEADSVDVTNWIHYLESKFDLVLLTDYLDESLILLKDLLCWSIDDVLYLRQNARETKNRTLTEQIKQNIREWNGVDTRMYDYFNKTLWRKVEEYGIERMNREVGELKIRNKRIAKDCVAGIMQTGDKRIWYPSGVKIETFKINPNASNARLCSQVTRPENEYIKVLSDRQRKKNIVIRKNRRKVIQRSDILKPPAQRPVPRMSHNIDTKHHVDQSKHR